MPYVFRRPARIWRKRPKIGWSLTGPILAALSASGAGAFSGVLAAQASASLNSAGTGAAAFTMIAQASAALSAAGVGAASYVITGKANGVLSSSGIGAAAFVGNSIGRSALASVGVGAFSSVMTAKASSVLASSGTGTFQPAMLAQVSSTLQVTGFSSFGASDSPASVAIFNGVGVFSGVAYAFFADAEKAGPVAEIRVVYVPRDDSRFFVDPPVVVAGEPRTTYAATENRVAFAQYERRVYEVDGKSVAPGPPRRRRQLQ